MDVRDLAAPQLIDMYRRMYLIRSFELEMAKCFKKDLIHGAVHSYLGQEAIAVGACSALAAEDFITSTHRGHGHCLAKGADPKLMMAEVFGKQTGYCKGKGGSMHIADLDLGILGANAIVGGSIGIATGAGFTSKYNGDSRVALCFFGDGALHQGIFHECANMAALWKLPVIYLAEYNHFAEFTHSESTFPIADLTLRSAPYGFPGLKIDGNDLLTVYQTTREAAQRARAGEGPTLIVAETFRLEGHYVGDPLTYRTKEEVDRWMALDAVSRFGTLLTREGILTEQQQKAIVSEIETQIAEAVDFAQGSPEPGWDDLKSDVWSLEGVS